MARELETDGLTALGRRVLSEAEKRSLTLNGLSDLLGWPAHKIYRVIRADAVQTRIIADLSRVLEIPLGELVALESR